MFDPAAIRDAQREAGLTRQVSVTIGGNTYAGVHVSWRQPDRSVFDDFSQQTDYRIKFWTDDLPGLKKGDSLVRGGVLYSIADTPSFDGPDGNWSSVRLARVERAYPKQSGDSIIVPALDFLCLREDGGNEMREDGGYALRE